MKPTQCKQAISAYLFATVVTLILCGFAAGILYVDMQSNKTVTSAGGLLWPLEEKLLTLTEQVFGV